MLLNQQELAAMSKGQQQTRLLTIQQANNGYILSAHDGSINVVEKGNEVDIFYALQRFFSFKALADEETEVEQHQKGGLPALDANSV